MRGFPHPPHFQVLLAQQLDILIPPTYQFRSLDEVFRAVPDLKLPVFLKVREGASGVGIKKCDTPEELTASFKEFVEGYELVPEQYPLIQQGIPGEDYCVSALFDKGRCVAKMTYRNVRAFPRTTGASALRETVPLPDGEAASIKLLEYVKWHGIAELDFISIFEKNVVLDPLPVHKCPVQAAEILHHVALASIKSNYAVLFGHDTIEHLHPVLRMTTDWVVLR